MKFDNEEQQILDEYEKGNIKTRKPTQAELDEIKSIAANTLKKDRTVTIRLLDHDFKGIQKKALEMGIPYKTLISGMIHRYLEGSLVERES
jgi:predicted DNA binding CopG/RHH family protein